jgi:hypothetical protein
VLELDLELDLDLVLCNINLGYKPKRFFLNLGRTYIDIGSLPALVVTRFSLLISPALVYTRLYNLLAYLSLPGFIYAIRYTIFSIGIYSSSRSVIILGIILYILALSISL